MGPLTSIFILILKRNIFIVELQYLNPLTTNVLHHIKTNQLICIADQLIGFYMVGNIGCYLLKINMSFASSIAVSTRIKSSYQLNEFFYKQHFCKQNKGRNWQKIKQKINNMLRLNFCYLKIMHLLHPCYHPRITGNIPKNKQKNKRVCIHENIRLIIMKIKMKKKNRSHRCHKNRTRPSLGQKCTKYKVCLSMMIVI